MNMKENPETWVKIKSNAHGESFNDKILICQVLNHCSCHGLLMGFLVISTKNERLEIAALSILNLNVFFAFLYVLSLDCL